MLRENDHGDLVDTAVHEAYPGHHLQLSFARRNPSLVRKALDPAIFSEGWALYSEELMAELGYYTDEERLIQLEWTLVRAARIVIDVGLHVADMTFDQAVKMLTDEVHLERAARAVRGEALHDEPDAAARVPHRAPDDHQDARALSAARRCKVLAEEVPHRRPRPRATVPPSLMAREIFGG